MRTLKSNNCRYPAGTRALALLVVALAAVLLAGPAQAAGSRAERKAKSPRSAPPASAADAAVPTPQEPDPFVLHVNALVDALADRETLPGARADILALGRDATPTLLTRYKDPRFTVRWEMVDIAVELRDPRAIPAVVDRVLRDEDPHVRWRGMYALAEFDDPKPVADLLLPVLQGEDRTEAHRAALALGFLKRTEGLALIHAGTQDPDPWIRWESIETLSKVHDATSADVLARVVETGSESERQQAVMSLSEIGGTRVRDVLVKALEDPSPGVRWRAAMLLSFQCSPAVAVALDALVARETDPEVLRNAHETLVTCSGQP